MSVRANAAGYFPAAHIYNGSFEGVIDADDLTADRTYSLPDGSGALLVEGQPIGGTDPAAGTFTTVSFTGADLTAANAAGPALLNEAATSNNPTVVANKADPDTGIGTTGANFGALIAGGAQIAQWYSGGIQVDSGDFAVSNAAGPALLNEAATSGNPTVVHNRAAPTYGLGGTATETSLIGGGNEVVTVGNNTLSFFAAAPAAKQTITGSRGGNAALADLLTKLATIGLITDSTS